MTGPVWEDADFTGEHFLPPDYPDPDLRNDADRDAAVHRRFDEAPTLTLKDLAHQAVMAVSLEELSQLRQAALNCFGDDAMELCCVDPHTLCVVPLEQLVVRQASRISS